MLDFPNSQEYDGGNLLHIIISIIPERSTIVANAKKAGHEEFRVVLSGLDLSDDQLQQVNGAIQRAALQAIADLDLKGDRAAALLPVNPRLSGKLPPWWDGHTWGIWWVDQFAAEEFERLISIR